MILINQLEENCPNLSMQSAIFLLLNKEFIEAEFEEMQDKKAKIDLKINPRIAHNYGQISQHQEILQGFQQK